MNRPKLLQIIELVAIFIIPAFVVLQFSLQKYFFLSLWFLAFGCYLINKKASSLLEFKKPIKNLLKQKALLKQRVMLFLLGSAFTLVFTYILFPNRFLSLPQEKPILWLMVMLLYPILSVIPQEIIYRSFFFERYKNLFKREWVMILANVALFSYAHIVFANWIAIIFTVIGGILFATSYSKTRSLLFVWFEHSLYGCMIFTSGLGWFFYRGTVQSLEKISMLQTTGLTELL